MCMTVSQVSFTPLVPGGQEALHLWFFPPFLMKEAQIPRLCTLSAYQKFHFQQGVDPKY